jgi:hypothetical protein
LRLEKTISPSNQCSQLFIGHNHQASQNWKHVQEWKKLEQVREKMKERKLESVGGRALEPCIVQPGIPAPGAPYGHTTIDRPCREAARGLTVPKEVAM